MNNMTIPEKKMVAKKVRAKNKETMETCIVIPADV